MLDQIINTATITVTAYQLGGDIYFPELHNYWFDEDGHGHICKD